MAQPLDLSALSSTDDEGAYESEAAWLNAFLAQHAHAPPAASSSSSSMSLSSLESTLSRTLGQLDAAAHDTSMQVDRLIDEISRGIPRLAFDLQLLRENALLLRYTLDSIRKRAGSGKGFGEDDQVSDVLEKLQILDTIKNRMQEARDVLREAESWSTLEGEVSSLLAENAHRKAAERLQEATKSMIVFQNTAEYEARRGLMISLQNQLETALSSSLVDAIKAHDVRSCKNYYAIFEMIEHEYEFTRYYFENRRAPLTATWTTAPLLDCSEAGQPNDAMERVKFSQFLSRFYASFHALLNEEKTYIPAIFPNPSPVLSDFVQTTLEGLSPSMSTRLTAVNDHYGPVVLPELITAYKAAEEFTVLVERLVSTVAVSALSKSPLASPGPSNGNASTAAGGSSPTGKRERRPSKRRSLSQRLSSRSISTAAGLGLPDNPADETVRAWETAILEPFLDFQSEYAALEQAFLQNWSTQIEGGDNLLAFMSAGDTGDRTSSKSSDGPRKVSDKAGQLILACEDAMVRLLAFTHGYAAVGGVRTIDDTLASFFMRRKAELGRVKVAERRGMTSQDEAGFEGLEYTTEDWAAFQNGLRLLDACRSISDKVKAFEAKLQSRLTNLAITVREARVDPSYTIPGTTRGAITLLRQSVLNSSELGSLLEPLEKNDGVARHFLHKARASKDDLAKATQQFLHRTLLAPLLAHLNDFARLPVWTSSSHDMPDGKGAFDLSIPTFSLSPTDPIARVGEGLFNLPRLFAVYANDDALGFSLATLPHVDKEELIEMAVQHKLATAPSEATPPILRHRSTGSISLSEATAVAAAVGSLKGPESNGADGSVVNGTNENGQGDNSNNSNERRVEHSIAATTTTTTIAQDEDTEALLRNLSPEIVVATWLSSLTIAILSHMTDVSLVRIERLTKHGARQLASDLGYVANVARTLDVEPSDEFEAWRAACEVEELNEAQIPAEASSGARNVWQRVIRMRSSQASSSGRR